MAWRFFLVFLVVSGACSAGTIDPSVPDGSYLSYGEQHECVVPIYGNCECGGLEGRHHLFNASAVVIDRKWLVTAAHVVDKVSGIKVKVGNKEHSIRKVIFSRRFKEENLGKYDIALCESEEDMLLDFYPELYESDDEVGKVVSICGYGTTGTFSTGANRLDGRKRAGSNTVDRLERHVMFCSVLGGRKTKMEFMIASGDSGGGLFIDKKLAGINSFVSADDGKSNSDYGDESAHTRISMFAGWIRASIRGEADDDMDQFLVAEAR